MNQLYIFLEQDPVTEQFKVMYLGITRQTLAMRLMGHIFNPPNKGMKEWVGSYWKDYRLPIMVALGHVRAGCNPEEVENYHIRGMRALGYEMLNVNPKDNQPPTFTAEQIQYFTDLVNKTAIPRIQSEWPATEKEFKVLLDQEATRKGRGVENSLKQAQRELEAAKRDVIYKQKSVDYWLERQKELQVTAEPFIPRKTWHEKERF